MADDPSFVINIGNGDTERWRRSTVRLPRDGGFVRRLRRLLSMTGDADGAILLGCVSVSERYFDQVAAGVLGRRGHPVVLAECTWEPVSRSLRRRGSGSNDGSGSHDEAPRGSGWLLRAVIRLLDTPRTHYCVLSEEERESFTRIWGVPRERVHNTRSLATVWSDEPYVGPGDGGVFAGGNSLRDYRALVEAAPHVPGDVTIATTLLPTRHEGRVRTGPVPPDEYAALAREATVVVVPIARSTRSAGQQTYLNAMLQGKPTIVTDSVGVRDHITPGEHALLVAENDPEALREALAWCLEHPDEAREMGLRARDHVQQNFTRGAYYDRILDVAEVAASSRRARRPASPRTPRSS